MLNLKVLNGIIIFSLVLIAAIAINNTFIHPKKAQTVAQTSPTIPSNPIADTERTMTHEPISCETLSFPFTTGSRFTYDKKTNITTAGKTESITGSTILTVKDISGSTIYIETRELSSKKSQSYELSCFTDGIYGIPFSLIDLGQPTATDSAKSVSGADTSGLNMISTDSITKDFLLIPSLDLIQKGTFEKNISFSFGGLPFLSTKIPLFYTITPGLDAQKYSVAVHTKDTKPTPSTANRLPDLMNIGGSGVNSYLKDVAIMYSIDNQKGIIDLSITMDLMSIKYDATMKLK